MISPGADTTRGPTSFFEGEEVAHPASRPEEGVPMLAQDKATRESRQRIRFWLRAWEFEFMWLFFAFIALGLVMALLGGAQWKAYPAMGWWHNAKHHCIVWLDAVPSLSYGTCSQFHQPIKLDLARARRATDV